MEDELLKWATKWDEGDDVVYADAKASMKKLAMLKLEKIADKVSYRRSKTQT